MGTINRLQFAITKNIPMHKIIIILLLFVSSGVVGQALSGKVTYERKTFWINIMSKLPFITQEDIDRDRLTWGKNEGKWGEKYEFTFLNNKSIYLEKEQETNYGYSWKNGKFILVRDYTEKTSKDLITIVDRDYLIESDSHKYKWKILNEIKEVQGYLCMKAETIDPVKGTKVWAWFTDKIMVSGGPEGYGGLPGLILAMEFNENDCIIEAVSVDLEAPVDKLPIPKKMKGKKIDREKYVALNKKIIKESVEGRKNPYWRLRY